MRTPLISLLKQALHLAKIANEAGRPPADELADIVSENKDQSKLYSRRKFLTGTAKAGLVLGVSALLPEMSYALAPPINTRIAIIGGGISGLTAAHYLKKAGINSFTIYEGDSRVGGRILSKKDILGQNLITEVGGEYIDSNHKDMFKLVKDYGLEMLDTFADASGLKKDAFFFEGRHYSLAEVIKAFQKVLPQIKKDQSGLDENYGNDLSQNLDNTPLSEYIQSLNGESWFKQMLDTAYMAEFGAPTSEQSSLNFLDMIDTTNASEFNVFGESDERYKIRGGNSTLTQAMAKGVENFIQTEMKLTGIYSVGKRYLLVFNDRQSIETDMVLLTIPFKVLRDVEMQIDGLTKVKRLCISDLGYGTNAKVMLGFNKRIWRSSGYMGYLFNENIHNGWDNGLFQNDPTNNAISGGYTIFLGGEEGQNIQRGMEQELARKYVVEMGNIFNGVAESYNGKAYLADWPQNPFIKGAYSFYKPGQWTTISGLEIEPIGNVYFAGEHCSNDFQGYMNGGAETGRVAAQTIIKKLKGKG